MPVTVSWVDGMNVPVEDATIGTVMAQATAEATARSLIAAFRADGAEITIVVGDTTGTTLVYFLAEYAETQVGSLLSVCDREAANANRWQPPLVADYFGHYTEFRETSARLRKLTLRCPRSRGRLLTKDLLATRYSRPR